MTHVYSADEVKTLYQISKSTLGNVSAIYLRSKGVNMIVGVVYVKSNLFRDLDKYWMHGCYQILTE